MSPLLTTRTLATDDLERFRRDGVVVMRAAFDPAPLVAEVEAAFAVGFAGHQQVTMSDEADIAFRHVPMMGERTPRSLALLHDLAGLADQLVGAETLPVRAKAVEYHGASSWHRDTLLDVASVGFACYLEPVTATTGALRVVPGSHRSLADADGRSRAATAVATAPGDVIAFDEHLLHSSRGGAVRRQWRVDFVARPHPADTAVVREYLGATFSPDWDAGYDVDALPTYGPHWRRTCRPADDELLEALGAYAAATAEEDAARRRVARRQQTEGPARAHRPEETP